MTAAIFGRPINALAPGGAHIGAFQDLERTGLDAAHAARAIDGRGQNEFVDAGR